MNYKRILSIAILFLIIISITTISFATDIVGNEITNDFKVSSRSSINGVVTYGVYIKKDNENVLLSFNASDYNLPPNLNEYKDDLRLRITYTPADNKVLDCKVVNNITDEIIEDVSEENINRLFNIEYGKTINEKSWVEKIKLSELRENEVYKYTATATVQFPEIENDVGENCIIYIKQWHDDTYNKEVKMYKKISGTTISGSFNEYKSGDAFYVMYRKSSTNELLKMIEQDEIIYLSNYNDGDKLEYQFEKYIYNDTQNDININIKNIIMGVEETDSTTIGKGQIYGFSWMLDSATISYVKDGNNQESDNGNTKEPIGNLEENNNQEQEEQNSSNLQEEIEKEEDKIKEPIKENNNQTNTELPQTGKSMILAYVILFLVAITIVSYIKQRNKK